MIIASLLVVAIIGSSISISYNYDEYLSDSSNTYKDTKEVMVDMLQDQDIDIDELDLPIKKDVLETVLKAEELGVRQNEKIKVVWKYTRKKKKKKKDGTKKTVTKTYYYTKDVTLKYYDYTYQYRLPWQLVYALAVVTEADKELVEEISKLQPKFKYKETLKKPSDKVYDWASRRYVNYTFGQVKNVNFKNYQYDNEGKSKHWIYTPVVAMDTVETFSKKYIYNYKKKWRGEDVYPKGYDCVIDSIEVVDNSERFIEYLNELDLTVHDIEFLIEIIKELPEGDMVAYELQDILDKAIITNLGNDREFSADIPLIQGDWTRDDLIATAMSLQGLDYFWGGKYPKKGANPNWGKLTTVTSPGSWSTGRKLPLGLDCSGFVEWVYYQMLGYSISDYGGTYSMWKKSYAIDKDDLKPGDLGFYNYGGGVHVGIYIGKIDGTDAFIHSGGRTWKDATHPTGQVIVSKQYDVYNGYPPSKFKYFRRFPVRFADDE